MKRLIDIDKEMIAHEMTLDDIHQLVARDEPIVCGPDAFYLCPSPLILSWQSDALERYEKGVESKAMEYNKKTSRQKYAKSDVYISFKQGIFVRVAFHCERFIKYLTPLQEVDHPNEAMPPLTGEIPRGLIIVLIQRCFSL
jgi:hypothetical protein